MRATKKRADTLTGVAALESDSIDFDDVNNNMRGEFIDLLSLSDKEWLKIY